MSLTRNTRPVQNRLAGRFSRLGRTGVDEVFDDLPRCWWETAELRPWWAREVADMKHSYPSFRWRVRNRYRDSRHLTGAEGPIERERVEREQCGEFVLAWRGPISPFPAETPLADVQAIVTDLDENRPVCVLADGVLAHYSECGGTHRPRPELQLKRPLYRTFDIEIAYRRPPGCPIARPISPRINDRHPLGQPPHLHNTIEALCVDFPPDRAWVFGRDGASQYADFTAIWLAKHLAWEEARERRVNVEKAWPGRAAGHKPFELPRLLTPRDPCRCGSAKSYAECHERRDAAERLQA